MKSCNNQIFHTITPLVWLFICPFVIWAPLPTMVLCIAADGHVEVEAVDGGRCASFVTATQQKASDFLPVSEVAPIPDHCGQCLDLPTFMLSSEGQYIVPIQKSTPQFNTPMIIPLPVTPLILTSTLTEISLPNSQPRANPILASLRTVTLLI